MKKIFSLFIILSVITFSFSIFATEELKELSYNDVILNNFNSEFKTLINEKIQEGMKIYYGEGTEINQTIFGNTRSFSQTINLPESGTVFSFNFSSIGQTLTSPCLFNVTSNCTMKVSMTSTEWKDSSVVRIKIIDQTTGQTIYDENEIFEPVNNILSINVNAGHKYYVTGTSTELPSYASLFVYGE
ncbi:hypothetical protein [Ructibacterium gallinarum]|uniref:Uncharacterized protein n=1 Tax=Ructibacterium gallinarum TaxID=2779355 RepID=A0A9D5R895_9FIRM|nr:hypothetical protein [Ructibacterium gallinarum]MBE5039234.1 hypothetical protein [Ructibacterium gallinarum]